MQIDDSDVKFAIRQIGRQLLDMRYCGDREGVNVQAPRCMGYISALATVGVISQHECIRITALANNAWEHAHRDTRR